MNALPLLALGALFLLGRKKPKATTRVVEREPEDVTRELARQLPVYSEEQVFGPESPAPAADPVVPEQAAQREQTPVEIVRQEEAVFSPMSPVAMASELGSKAQPDQPAEMAEPVATVGPVMPSEVEHVEVMAPDPARAARELADYVTKNRGKGAKLGTKGKPSDTVRALQLQMGELDADGIYGPQTRARGRALGVAMPPRG